MCKFVKMQISNVVMVNPCNLLASQTGSLRLGALTSVGALFYLGDFMTKEEILYLTLNQVDGYDLQSTAR